MLICGLVSVVLLSYVLVAATLAVALLTTNDFASPARNETPGTPVSSSVGVNVRVFVPALRVELKVVLISIVPVIPATLTLIELAPAVNV
jgi:hypothetical protein